MVVTTTCSNAADTKLYERFSPTVVFVDEAVQSIEAETLTAWAFNVETVRRIVLVGDPQQLGPTVVTDGMNYKDTVVNPFAAQLSLTLFKRLAARGMPILRLTEQHRAIGGLEQVYNHLFYGFLKNSDDTNVNRHSDAQAARKWSRTRYTKPHMPAEVFLNVATGICLRGVDSSSRYNPHFIVAGIHEIKAMLKDTVWNEQDIIVITPYKYAVVEGRKALHKEALYAIRVNTVDGFQGGQHDCVIVDTSLAQKRDRGPGFMRSHRRINVALSRAKKHRVVIGDIDALKLPAGFKKKLAEMDETTRAVRVRQEEVENRYLQGLYDYYKGAAVVKNVNPAKYAEWVHVDFGPIQAFEIEMKVNEAFREGKEVCKNCGGEDHDKTNCAKPNRNIVCRNCGEKGHMRKECPRKTMACHLCHELDHLKKDCPQSVCSKCQQTVHNINSCTGPDLRQCGRCKEIEHIKSSCTATKPTRLMFEMPYGSAGVASAPDYIRPAASDDVAPTQETTQECKPGWKAFAQKVAEAEKAGEAEEAVLAEEFAVVEEHSGDW